METVSYISAPGMIKGYKIPGRTYSSNHIVKKVCEFSDVTKEELMLKCRKRHFVEIRHIAMYFMREFTSMSLVQIAAVFNLDHTSAIHGHRMIKDLMEFDERMRTRVQMIMETF